MLLWHLTKLTVSNLHTFSCKSFIHCLYFQLQKLLLLPGQRHWEPRPWQNWRRRSDATALCSMHPTLLDLCICIHSAAGFICLTDKKNLQTFTALWSREMLCCCRIACQTVDWKMHLMTFITCGQVGFHTSWESPPARLRVLRGEIPQGTYAGVLYKAILSVHGVANHFPSHRY